MGCEFKFGLGALLTPCKGSGRTTWGPTRRGTAKMRGARCRVGSRTLRCLAALHDLSLLGHFRPSSGICGKALYTPIPQARAHTNAHIEVDALQCRHTGTDSYPVVA